MKFSLFAAFIALGFVLSSPKPVLAYGNEDVTSTTISAPKKCKKGKTWSKKKKRCVRKSSSPDQGRLTVADRDASIRF